MKTGVRDYDSTVARIAGNIASGLTALGATPTGGDEELAAICVKFARAIVAETKRTEPKEPQP